MRIFVTGASGFIGSHVAEALSKDHQIVAMARSERSAEAVRKWGAEPVTCSLTDVAAGHLDGVDAVVHAAGVRRFIHIGTEAAVFDGRDLVDIDENFPYPARQRFL